MRKLVFIFLFFASNIYAQSINPALTKTANVDVPQTNSNAPLTVDSIAYPTPFTLTSTDFQNQSPIPSNFACLKKNGGNQIPHLSWQYPPHNVVSYMLIMSDPDAPSPPFTHWIVYNIPANATSLDASSAQLYAQGINSYGHQAYDGPCPPSGKVHHYVFTLYAYTQYFPVKPPLNATEANYIAQQTQSPNLLGSATLIGTFSS